MLDLLIVAIVIAIVVSFAALVMRVEEWLTLSALEAKIECPLAFLENPNLFRIFRLIAFAIACIALVWREGMFAGTGTAIFCWIAFRWLGRKIALMTIRNRYREMLSSADSSINPNDRASYETFVRMSDRELISLMKYMQGKT